MPRLARIVAPNLPHHVTQRGNRRETIFFEPGDHQVYLRHLAREARKARVEIWAYCLMPNHVHLILVPADGEGLAHAVGETHRCYTNFINNRRGATGHLFQARFASVVMDDAHLINAARYVSLNPVRAGLVSRPEDWPWSSVRAHLQGRDDGVVKVAPILERVGDFSALIGGNAHCHEEEYAQIRKSESTGRPLGSKSFVAALERDLGRTIALRRPGRKPREIEGQDTYFPHFHSSRAAEN
jgi:putative transposase